MTMGESAGRSADNKVGQGARRRNTPRERSYVDPVRDTVQEIAVVTPEEREKDLKINRWLIGAMVGSYLLIFSLLALVVYLEIAGS